MATLIVILLGAIGSVLLAFSIGEQLAQDSFGHLLKGPDRTWALFGSGLACLAVGAIVMIASNT